MYLVSIIHNAYAQVMEAEHSIALTIYSSKYILIYSARMALRNDYGFS